MNWSHCTAYGLWEDCTLEPMVQPMPHGKIVPWNPLCDPPSMGRLYLRTNCTTYVAWVDYTMEPIVQPMVHGQIVPQHPLYNACPMGRLYPGTHCTTHAPWVDYTSEPIVQPMAHGQIVPKNPLYNAWPMGRLYFGTHCTTHGTCPDYTPEPIVQCMVHGWIIPWNSLYNPWSMGISIGTQIPCTMGCTTPLYSIVWPMGHGALSNCIAHGSWDFIAEWCDDSAIFIHDSTNFVHLPGVGLHGGLPVDHIYCNSSHSFPGFTVAQIQLILHPIWDMEADTPLYLVYTQQFDIVHQLSTDPPVHAAIPDPITGSYVLKCAFCTDRLRIGAIIPLSQSYACPAHSPLWQKGRHHTGMYNKYGEK